MKLLGCVLLLGASQLAADDMRSTLLALKDANAPRKLLSDRLTDQMMRVAKPRQSPSRASVQRFSEELTMALTGRDSTSVRAAALQKALSDVMRGNGSTFMPATTLRETLTGCGVDEPTGQAIVRHFIDIGQEVRGPDDMKLMMK